MSFNRIAVWHQNWLGDILFQTPFLKSLRKQYNNAYIKSIINSDLSGLLDLNPNINGVITLKNPTRLSFVDQLLLINKLKKEKFDAVFILHRSLTRGVLVYLAGIPKRIGFSYNKRNFIMTDTVRPLPGKVHRIDFFLKIAEHFKCDTSDKKMDFHFSREDSQYAKTLMESMNVALKRPVVILNPGANWKPKRWSVKKFSDLCGLLNNELGVTPIITGSEKDREIAFEIKNESGVNIVDLCGKTTLRQLGALFKLSSIIVTADTGPLHIANAVDTDVIALFGPTSPKITGPLNASKCHVIQKIDEGKVPCYEAKCNNQECMDLITSREVFDKLKTLI